MGPEHSYFAGAGCQVIVGFPKYQKRVDNDMNPLSETGTWKTFRENAYAIDQQSFDYMLLIGRDVQRAGIIHGYHTPRLRYGSKGALVTEEQEKLKTLNYYEGNIDDDFGPRTLNAILNFQEDRFDKNADDGIVGSMTTSTLGIDWPEYGVQ